MSRDLDYAPLTSRPRVRSLLRAVAGNNLWVMAGTVGALLLVVPLAVLVGLVATGQAGDDLGALFVLGFVLLCGVLVAADLVGKSYGSSALAAFARANDLELLRASLATHYAAREFATGRSSVHQAVRTRDEHWVEVGEWFPIDRRIDRFEPRTAQVYLRAGLARAVRLSVSGGFIDPGLDADLTAWAGTYTVEASGDEVTVLGSRELDPRHFGRVREGFELTDRLVARADALLRPAETTAPTSGIPLPERPTAAEGGTARPLVVVVSMLGLLTVIPLGFAVVMSWLGDSLRGNDVGATIVVAGFIGLVMLVVGGFARAVVRPRAGRRRD